MIKKDSVIGVLVISLFLAAIILNQNPKPVETEKPNQTTLFPKNGIAIIDLYGPIAFPQYSNDYMPMAANLTLEQQLSYLAMNPQEYLEYKVPL